MSTLANLEQIDELVIQGAHFFVSHSGGKDSQAMYAAITKRVPPRHPPYPERHVHTHWIMRTHCTRYANA